MKRMSTVCHIALAAAAITGGSFISTLQAATNAPFVGRITATLAQGDQSLPLLFTVGTNAVRVEITDTRRPHPINLRDRHSEALILVFPHNRSFVRLPSATPPHASPGPSDLPSLPRPIPTASAFPPGPSAPPVIGPTNVPGVPPGSLPAPPPGAPAGLPPGIGPQTGAAPGLGTALGMSALPTMPMMPPMMEAAPELKPTGQTTNLLGYACRQFELAQRGQRLEIWATDRLLPFPGYLRQQPHRFGPQMVEEQWPELLRAKKLFPMQVSLDGCVRLAVTAVTPEQVKDETQTLFQPPADYHELEPLPF
jgi:hypothetical protein